jgi:hypothetical protein
MIHVRHDDEPGRAGLRAVDRARDQQVIVELLEPVVLAVKNQRRLADRGHRREPVLRVRLLVEAEGAAI